MATFRLASRWRRPAGLCGVLLGKTSGGRFGYWRRLGACWCTLPRGGPSCLCSAHDLGSRYRETERMRDGSDAIADWPILNALLNTASGASWVSFHHGGGVGIGYSLHAGMVVVADGTAEADERLARVLTNDPGTGVMRHADAGYPEAILTARARGMKIPMLGGE